MNQAAIRFTAEEIAERVAELGRQIREDFEGERPVLVSVIKGSVVFLADLARKVGVDADIDFLSVSEFGGGMPKTGVVRIIKDLEIPIQDRHVVVAETIVDTGLTLSFLLRTLQYRSPASLKVCALLDKPIRRIAQTPIDYLGFEISEYVVGYGLGFKGKYRNLPYIVGIKDVAALNERPDSLHEMLRSR